VFLVLLPVLLMLWSCMLLWLATLSCHHYMLLVLVRRDRQWNIRWPQGQPGQQQQQQQAAAEKGGQPSAEQQQQQQHLEHPPCQGALGREAALQAGMCEHLNLLPWHKVRGRPDEGQLTGVFASDHLLRPTLAFPGLGGPKTPSTSAIQVPGAPPPPPLQVDVDCGHYHAHAAIACRSSRFAASHGHVVEYTVRQMRELW